MKESYSVQPVSVQPVVLPVLPNNLNLPVNYRYCSLQEGEYFVVYSNKVYIARFRFYMVKDPHKKFINEFKLEKSILNLHCNNKLKLDVLNYFCYKDYYNAGNNDLIKINGIILLQKEGY